MGTENHARRTPEPVEGSRSRLSDPARCRVPPRLAAYPLGHARISAGRTEVRRGASRHRGGSGPGRKTPARDPSEVYIAQTRRFVTPSRGRTRGARNRGHCGPLSPPGQGVSGPRTRYSCCGYSVAIIESHRRFPRPAVPPETQTPWPWHRERGVATSVPLSSLGLGGVGDLGACPRFRKRPAVKQRERDGHDEE